MGMCAIYTSIPANLVRDPVAAMHLVPEDDEEARVRGMLRQPFGRHAVMSLAVIHASPSHRDIVRALQLGGWWWMFTPGGAQPLEPAEIHDLLARIGIGLSNVPMPLWPPSPVLACLLGAPPAVPCTYHTAISAPTTVSAAAVLLAGPDHDALDGMWRALVRGTAARDEALLVHWQYR